MAIEHLYNFWTWVEVRWSNMWVWILHRPQLLLNTSVVSRSDSRNFRDFSWICHGASSERTLKYPLCFAGSFRQSSFFELWITLRITTFFIPYSQPGKFYHLAHSELTNFRFSLLQFHGVVSPWWLLPGELLIEPISLALCHLPFDEIRYRTSCSRRSLLLGHTVPSCFLIPLSL